MKVLIACEESQRVCIAFRERGHEAYSCDIVEPSGGHPEWHIRDDVMNHLKGWDLIIAHPPCTDLCVSGARYFAQKRKDGRQQRSIDFFMKFTEIDCPHVCIENPVGIMSTIWRKPDQIIHPWQFGDNYEKTTCLWLKGLPKLIPEVTVKPELEYQIIHSKNGKIYRMPLWYSNANIKTRSKIRSKTFPGIAKAMAEQWG